MRAFCGSANEQGIRFAFLDWNLCVEDLQILQETVGYGRNANGLNGPGGFFHVSA